jgi:hypothetical protein
VIRWSTALAVLGVAGIAAVVSYERASALVRSHGESGWTGRLIPLTVDGLITEDLPDGQHVLCSFKTRSSCECLTRS